MSGRTHSKRFRLRKDAVPVAREHVRAVLASWFLGELADDAESIVGELAANAVVHARGIGAASSLRWGYAAGTAC